jgi:hypothetical protein
MSDDRPSVVTPGAEPLDLPPTPAASVEVIACGNCALLDKVDPLTLRASATRPCLCGCGWDEFVCQICGTPIGLQTTLGKIDLGDVT